MSVVKFSNPRKVAEFNDWPIGGSNRGQCKFEVETHPKRGQRVARTTTDKYGNWCKPKYLTYAESAVIVDGNDGKTYILTWSGVYGFIAVHRHDFISAERSGIWDRDDDFEEVKKLLGV